MEKRSEKQPTKKQIQLWEDEGGLVPPPEEDMGELYHPSVTKKMRNYLTKMWRALNSNNAEGELKRRSRWRH